MEILQTVDPKYLLVGVLGIVILYFIIKLLKTPIKIMIKLIVNGIFGVILLYGVNIVGANFDFHIGINAVTALVAGILGIPGVIALILIKLFI